MPLFLLFPEMLCSRSAFAVSAFAGTANSGMHGIYPQFRGINPLQLQTDTAHPLVFNVDSNYVGYFSVALQSIIDTANKKFTYDIIVLEDSIHKIYKQAIEKQIACHENFSVRYLPMAKIIEKYNVKSWFISRHINHAAYYRLFIPLLLKSYTKVIYLDSDIIVRSDIAELYDTDIEDNLIAAVVKYDTMQYSNNYIDYLKNILSIRDTSQYFNSGVLIFNIHKMIKTIRFDEFLKIAKINNLLHHDQDVLNAVCQGFVKFLDKTWNVLWHHLNYPKEINMSPEDLAFLSDNAKIIHYNGLKPIACPMSPYSLLWWRAARKTEFCEQIMCVEQQKRTPLKAPKPKACTPQNTQANKHIYLQARLDELLKLSNAHKVTALCFGTGSMAENILPSLRPDNIKINAFIDERPSMLGTTYAGSPVIDFAQIKNSSFDYILVACRPAEHIIERLRALGIPAEKIVSLDVENFLRQQGAQDEATLCAYLQNFPYLIQAIDVPTLLDSPWLRSVRQYFA